MMIENFLETTLSEYQLKYSRNTSIGNEVKGREEV